MRVNRLRAVYAILVFCALGTRLPIGFAQSTAQPDSKLSMAPESNYIFETRMTMEIFDYAQTPRRTLRQAEQVASGIFARAGVNLFWIDCVAGGKPRPGPECNVLIGPSRLGVRILPRIPVIEGMTGDATLGYTVGDLTAISLDWAETASANDLGSVADFLGCAIAHELGHVLLGTHSHSVFGLMRSRWDAKALQAAAQHTLLFAPEQAATIRAGVVARARAPATLAMAPATPGK